MSVDETNNSNFSMKRPKFLLTRRAIYFINWQPHRVHCCLQAAAPVLFGRSAYKISLVEGDSQ